MKTFDIKGTLRTDSGKKATKALRKEGKVPCVIYGGESNIHFALEMSDLKHLVYTPNIFVSQIDIDGKVHSAIMRDLQFHPVSDKVLHIDFLEVTDDRVVTIKLPVVINGVAEGVKAGGKLQVELRNLAVKGQVKNLPDTLDINVTELGLGKTIQVKELGFDNLEIVSAKEAVVVAVKLTRAAKAKQ